VAGLTERTKRRTRAEIGAAARRLFLEYGFDQVTVAQVAAAAEVSEKTVYNHFPTKAHLVFDEDESVQEGLVRAIRTRAPGESALSAIRTALTAMADRMGSDHPAEARQAFRRMVLDSDTLRNHQRAMAARYEQALTDVLTEETGVAPGSPEPFIAAVALVGALRAGFEVPHPAAIDRALTVLERGLADYATGQEP
jgi:AcrR family transcriptional regulator